MAITPTRLDLRIQTLAAATTFQTNSVSPAAGSAVLLVVAMRASDLATMAGEVAEVSGVATTWTPIGDAGGVWDVSSRSLMASFLGTGTFSTGAITVGTVSDRTLDRGNSYVIQVVSDNPLEVVQADFAYFAASTLTIANSLAAFADPANTTLQLASLQASTTGFTLDTSPTGYATLNASSTAQTMWAQWIAEDDTAPTCTVTDLRAIGTVAFELAEAVAGPTITVQPAADVVLINGDPTRASAAFSVTATGTGTLLYDWELEETVGGGTYVNVPDGAGLTWTGQAAASLTAVVTAKTQTGKRVRCNVTDDNGTTTTDAVLLTIYTGPTISTTSGTTDGSGQDVITCASDYPNDVIPGEYTEFSATSEGITETVSVVFQTP